MRNPSPSSLLAHAARTLACRFRIDRAKMGAGQAAPQHARLALRKSGRYYVFEAFDRRTPPADHAERVISIMTAFSTGFRPICFDRI
jgi:hypothetical protein